MAEVSILSKDNKDNKYNKILDKEGECMDDARRKLRICLLCIVTAAVIIGGIYYFGSRKETDDVREGTLVRQERVWQEAKISYI